MKFIHAVIFDVDEFNNGHYNTEDWGDLCDGDYVVHCLYCVDTEDVIILEDNCHASVENMIDSFIDGVNYMCDCAIVKKAYIVVDNGLSYDKEAVTLCLVEGAYVEVM